MIMKISDLPLPKEFASHLNSLGFVELFPPQAAAVESGLLEGRNLLVASPTACYDEKTEVLTRGGWKFFTQVDHDEEVLSMDPETLEMHYLRAERKVEYLYRGRMVHVEGEEIDFRVTENHNMFVYHRHQAQHEEPAVEDPEAAGSMIGDTTRRLRYDFHPAREISADWRFVTNGVWRGREQRFFELPPPSRGSRPSRRGQLPSIKMPTSDFLNFLGLYMAAGSVRFGRGDHEVTLRQKKRDHLRAEEALERLKIAEVRVTGPEDDRHFSVSCPQLARYLSQFGGAHERYVPDFVQRTSLLRRSPSSSERTSGWVVAPRRTASARSSTRLRGVWRATCRTCC